MSAHCASWSTGRPSIAARSHITPKKPLGARGVAASAAEAAASSVAAMTARVIRRCIRLIGTRHRRDRCAANVRRAWRRSARRAADRQTATRRRGSEAKNEAARAALKPLAPGERPTAVTVGAIVAALFAVANVVAVVLGWDQGVDEDDRARALAYTILATGVLLVVAWGMWKSKYWAVLGMQTLLALTLIASVARPRHGRQRGRHGRSSS